MRCRKQIHLETYIDQSLEVEVNVEDIFSEVTPAEIAKHVNHNDLLREIDLQTIIEHVKFQGYIVKQEVEE